MPYCYNKLLGKIKEKYRTQGRFADALGLSERSLYLKLKSERSFKQSEISKALELLGLGTNEIYEYFFTR